VVVLEGTYLAKRHWLLLLLLPASQPLHPRGRSGHSATRHWLLLLLLLLLGEQDRCAVR
jgi:hypothetical protein